MAMDMSFTAVPGSEMAAMYGSQRSVPSQFSSVIRDDAAAYFHSSTSVPPEAVEQARASISNSLMAVRQALADNNLSPAQQDEITAMIDRIVDLGLKSMSEGRSDLGLVVLADQTQFRFAETHII